MTAVVDLDLLMREAKELEPLPASVARLAGLIAEDDPDLNEIIGVITYDQALTGRLLRYANSAASASRHPISTARAAIIRMGAGSVLAVTVASCMRGQLDMALPEYGLVEGEMWRHSVAAAVAAESMANLCRTRIPAESFTAALLHDMGKLLLARHVDPVVRACLQSARERSGPDGARAEAELFGVSHAELGGLIAQQWKLPLSIVEGISFHHEPARGEAVICDVVHVANVVAKSVPRAGSGEKVQDEAHGIDSADADALQRLDLDCGVLSEVAQATASRLDEVLAQYSTR